VLTASMGRMPVEVVRTLAASSSTMRAGPPYPLTVFSPWKADDPGPVGSCSS